VAEAVVEDNEHEKSMLPIEIASIIMEDISDDDLEIMYQAGCSVDGTEFSVKIEVGADPLEEDQLKLYFEPDSDNSLMRAIHRGNSRRTV